MRLGACKLQNFGSYRNLEFNFRNQGLALISGPTGSGKSTLMDAAAWCLYGLTAKDGNSDEVRSWLTPDEPTTGELEIELPNGKITVYRSRCPNDLFWIEPGQPVDKIRGKDLQDTQKLLEARLAVSSETFLTSAYFHEFSQVGTFFTAKAKERREVFERIADLSFPNFLSDRCREFIRSVKRQYASLELEVSKRSGRLDQLDSTTHSTSSRATAWQKEHEKYLKELQVYYENFELEKESKIQASQTKHEAWEAKRNKETDKLIEKIDALINAIEDEDSFYSLSKLVQSLRTLRCKECGSPKAGEALLQVEERIQRLKEKKTKLEVLQESLSRLREEQSPHAGSLQSAKALINYYGKQLEAENKAINHYSDQLTKLEAEQDKLQKEQDAAVVAIAAMKIKASALEQIQDLSGVLRTELLQKAVSEIQVSTNTRLEKYFDAEIRVNFALGDTDSLDVSIQKSGYECVYRQLSKGQRQMLKLCFAVSVMESASNNAGVNFSCLFMDEALDGLDPSMKVKAFSLFEELSLKHESILLIDHSEEFSSMFSKSYRVSLEGDESTIEESNV